MLLKAELYAEPPGFVDALAASLLAITKLKGLVEIVPQGSLPRDGKVIADERPVG
jgi:phenylacetate-CoA ligase